LSWQGERDAIASSLASTPTVQEALPQIQAVLESQREINDEVKSSTTEAPVERIVMLVNNVQEISDRKLSRVIDMVNELSRAHGDHISNLELDLHGKDNVLKELLHDVGGLAESCDRHSVQITDLVKVMEQHSNVLEKDVQEIVDKKLGRVTDMINQLSGAYDDRFVLLEVELQNRENALQELLCGVGEHHKHPGGLVESLDRHAAQMEGLVKVMGHHKDIFEKDMREHVERKLSRITDTISELSGVYEDRFLHLEVDFQNKDDALKELLFGVQEHHDQLGGLAESCDKHSAQIAGLVQVMEHHRDMLEDSLNSENVVPSNSISTEDLQGTQAQFDEHTHSREMLHTEACLVPDNLLENLPLLRSVVEAPHMQQTTCGVLSSQSDQRDSSAKLRAELQRVQEQVQQSIQQLVEQSVQQHLQQSIDKHVMLTSSQCEKQSTEQHVQQSVQLHSQQSIEKHIQQSVQQHVQQSVEQCVAQSVWQHLEQHVEQQIHDHGMATYKLDLHAGQLSDLHSRIGDLETTAEQMKDRLSNRHETNHVSLQHKVDDLEQGYNELKAHVDTKCPHQDVQDQIACEARRVQDQIKAYGGMVEANRSHVEATNQACLTAVKVVTEKLDRLQASEKDLRHILRDEQAQQTELAQKLLNEQQERMSKDHEIVMDWRLSIAQLKTHLLSAIESERDKRNRENAEQRSWFLKSIQQVQANKFQDGMVKGLGCEKDWSHAGKRSKLGIFGTGHPKSQNDDPGGGFWFGI